MTRRHALKSAAALGKAFIPPASFAEDGAVRIGSRAVELALTTVRRNVVRIAAQPIESARPVATPSDGALIKDNWGKPVASFRSLNAPRTVKCGEMNVTVSNQPLAIRVTAEAGRLIQELRLDPRTNEFSFPAGDGPVFGLGQGGPQFDRRGHVDRMRSGQGGFELRTHGAKVPIPFLIGTSGWAMFVHAPLAAFDLTAQEGRIQPIDPAAVLPIDLFVIAAKSPEEVMSAYAEITGYPEMPPLWAFGYQQSHRTLGTPEEILAEAKIFREKKMPCESMIYLGTDFCPNGWNTHNGEFTWNATAFPDPPQAIQQLHDDHFHVVLHVVVEGHHFTGTVHDPCTAPPIPPGRTPDNHWPDDRQVSCYWPAHKPLFDLGVDGWWPDQGDGYDAASRLRRNRMYFEGSQMYRPNQRVYALHRNGYAGMQRYASFLWSGDVQSTWETLKTHIAVGINAGLSGIPYWGTDIGGFVPTAEYTGELFARWFQFAAFTPLFRSHGRDWRLHLPWGWTNGQIGYAETPSYHPDPAELNRPEFEPICKHYLELRSQMMPYLYSAVEETCRTGLPIIRALWLHYPEDPVAVARGDEYLYGRDILVAPVVEKSAASRSVYLPRGDWYDFWTKEKIQGRREVTRAVNLATIPLYVRAGAILPMGPIRQYVEENVTGPVTLLVHPGASGTFFLYEDDGKTFNYRRGDFTRLQMEWDDPARRLHVHLAPGSRRIGSAKHMVVKLVGETAEREFVFDGKPVQIGL